MKTNLLMKGMTTRQFWLGCTGLSLCLLVSSLQMVTVSVVKAVQQVGVFESLQRDNKNSGNAAISGDGRFVAFSSDASRLIDGDSNDYEDIFVHDLQTGEITRVSVASDGTEADGYSERLDISGNGRFVVFTSLAANLVANDTNLAQDIFVHDRQTGETTRVSVASDGTEATGWSDFPVISYDGRFVAFESSSHNLVSGDTNNTTDVFVHDRQTGETVRVSVASDGTEPNRSSSTDAMSDNGRFVIFSTWADNVVAGDNNGVGDVFVHDRETGETTRISVANDGAEGDNYSDRTSMSSDGRFIAFTSLAGNLVNDDTNAIQDVFVRDQQTGVISRVSVGSSGEQGEGQSILTSMSSDGRFVTFVSDAPHLVAGDTNGVSDVFIHDRQTSETVRVSIASDGAEAQAESAQGSVSDNGRFIAFRSSASNLAAGDTLNADVFVHDQQTGETRLVSAGDYGQQGNEGSYGADMSSDGRFVAFVSLASNLVLGDTNGVSDIFVYDDQTQQVICASLSTSGQLGNKESTGFSLSDNGRFVAFLSAASNLVSSDTNNERDVFVHDIETRETTRVSVASDGSEANGGSSKVMISGNGRFVFFQSVAGNLVSGDTNFKSDLFVHDRQTGETTLISLAGTGVVENSSSTIQSVSGDGRFVAFTSSSSNLVADDTNGTDDAFVYDRQTGETTRVSIASDGTQGNDRSTEVEISDNGRFVSFSSSATNLVTNDNNGSPDSFIHDRETGVTTRESVATDGSPSNGYSSDSLVTNDGRFAFFVSAADNLVADDTNGFLDVFVRDRQTGGTTRLSVSSDGVEGNRDSFVASISSNGRFVVFVSLATNLVTEDVNDAFDVFLHDRETGTTRLISLVDTEFVATNHLYLPVIRK